MSYRRIVPEHAEGLVQKLMPPAMQQTLPPPN
jgi:hypothetical protein